MTLQEFITTRKRAVGIVKSNGATNKVLRDLECMIFLLECVCPECKELLNEKLKGFDDVSVKQTQG